MKILLKNGESEIRFSNYSEGFDILVGEEYLHFRPWDTLVPFVSAVVDYSHANGLGDIDDEDLKSLELSLTKALDAANEEILYRNKEENKS